jgi:hypothetical protein
LRNRLKPSKLSQYIKDLGLSYKETSKSFVFACPLCGGKDKLYIRKADGRFKCFRCATQNGFSGQVEYALLELTNIPLKTIQETLYGSTQVQASYLQLSIRDFFDEEETEEEPTVDEIPSLDWPYHCIPILHDGAMAGREYLNRRGVPPAIATEYQIRYSPENRAVVFPVYLGERLVGWQFRTIDPTRVLVDGVIQERPKAWSSKDLPSDKVFMFANRLCGMNHAVVCEGPIDSIKCHLFGGNVSVMGKYISPTHVSILLRSGIKHIYAGLDPDAFAELDPLLTKLGDSATVYRPELPKSKSGEKVDLGSLSMEDALSVLQQAKEAKKSRLAVWMNPCFLTQPRI